MRVRVRVRARARACAHVYVCVWWGLGWPSPLVWLSLELVSCMRVLRGEGLHAHTCCEVLCAVCNTEERQTCSPHYLQALAVLESDGEISSDDFQVRGFCVSWFCV